MIAVSCCLVLLWHSSYGHPIRQLRAVAGAAALEHGPEGEQQTKHHEDAATPTAHDLEHTIDFDRFAFSVMFLGVTVAIVSLTYLANNPDLDVRAAMWQMLSNGTTIFLAVLLFWSVKTLFGRSFGKGVIVYLVLVIIFVLLLQLGLLGASYVDGPTLHGCDRSVIACQTVGGLLAHITGFAWLAFWTEVQAQLYHTELHEWGLVLVFFVACGIHMLMMLICFKCRQAVLTAMGRSSRGDDDEACQQEHRWHEVAAEALLEAGALMLSLMAIDLLKVAITGNIPDFHGQHSETGAESRPEPWQIIIMLIITCALPALIVWSNYTCGSSDVDDQERIVHRLGMRWLRLRSFQLVGKFACFLSALVLLCTVQWICEAFLHSTTPTGRRYLVETAVALVATAVAYAFIWCIGRVDQVLASAKSFAALEAGEDLLVTVGVMAGFAWEHVFHEAVEAVSEFVGERFGKSHHSPLVAWSDVMLALGILALLLPTLYWHINPQARRTKKRAQQHFRKVFDEDEEEDDEEDSEDEDDDMEEIDQRS